MNKIERVRAALAGQPVDRVPASFWFHFDAAHAGGAGMAEAHISYYRQADPDFLKVMNDNGYALTGVDALRVPGDWRRLRPTPLSSPPFQEQLDGLKRISDALGNEVLLVATIFNPFATGNNSAGISLPGSDISFPVITAHMREDPAAVNEGLAVIAESLAQFAQACVNAGAAGIYVSANGGERARFPAEIFEQYIKPHDLTVLQAARDAGATFNLLHMCGAELRMQSYAGYPADAVNWSPQLGNLSLRQGRDLFQRTIVGGMDQNGVIVTGDQATITVEARRALAEVGPTGFMLGAGCTVPPTTPIIHLRWAREALATP